MNNLRQYQIEIYVIPAHFPSCLQKMEIQLKWTFVSFVAQSPLVHETDKEKYQIDYLVCIKHFPICNFLSNKSHFSQKIYCVEI